MLGGGALYLVYGMYYETREQAHEQEMCRPRVLEWVEVNTSTAEGDVSACRWEGRRAEGPWRRLEETPRRTVVFWLKRRR
jgi:hypothetical protein